MLQVRPSLEADYESPKLDADQPLVVRHAAVESLVAQRARRAASRDVRHQVPHLNVTTWALPGRYDRTDSPGELDFDTGPRPPAGSRSATRSRRRVLHGMASGPPHRALRLDRGEPRSARATGACTSRATNVRDCCRRARRSTSATSAGCSSTTRASINRTPLLRAGRGSCGSSRRSTCRPGRARRRIAAWSPKYRSRSRATGAR